MKPISIPKIKHNSSISSIKSRRQNTLSKMYILSSPRNEYPHHPASIITHFKSIQNSSPTHSTYTQKQYLNTSSSRRYSKIKKLPNLHTSRRKQLKNKIKFFTSYTEPDDKNLNSCVSSDYSLLLKDNDPKFDPRSIYERTYGDPPSIGIKIP